MIKPTDHIALLLSNSYDNQEITRLFEIAFDMCENLFGGRWTVMYSPEIKYITSVIYILLALGSSRQTIGQDFCGLGVSAPKGSEYFRLSCFMAYSVLHSLGTYFEERYSAILPNLESAVNELLAPMDQVPAVSNSNEITINIQSDQNYIVKNKIDFFTLILIEMVWMKNGQDFSSRLKVVLSKIQSIHDFIFFANDHQHCYPDFATRLSSLYFIGGPKSTKVW
jgi:hypothetical protein